MCDNPFNNGRFDPFDDDDNPGGTGADDLQMAEPPVGYIPRMFLEPIVRELTQDEVDTIIATGQFQIGDEQGNVRAPTDAEVRAHVQEVVGVRDTRTGAEIPRQSSVPFRQVTL